MKTNYVYIAFCLLILSFLIGCKTFLDVQPKEILTPFEFNNSSVRVKYRKDTTRFEDLFGTTRSVLTDLNDIQFTISKTFNDSKPGLKYGAYVFYDSLKAATTIKTGQTFGSPDYFSVDSTSEGLIKKIHIRIDLSKGQFQYIVLVGIDSLTSNNNTKLYLSQGIIKVKINPWRSISDIDYYSPQQYNTKLFSANGKLGLVKFNNKELFIYLYESNRWTLKGSFKNTINCNSCGGLQTGGRVTNIENAYYLDNQYRFVVTASAFNPVEFGSGYGELVADQQFSKISYEERTSSGQSIEYYSSAISGDTLKVLKKMRYPYPRLNMTDTKDYSVADANWYNLAKKTTNNLSTSDKNKIKSPTIAAFIGNKLVANSIDSPSTINIYEPNGSEYIFQNKTITVPSEFAPLLKSRLITFCDNDKAYILMGNQSVGKLSITNNDVSFTKLYSSWIPGNSTSAIVPGTYYQGKLVCLVNFYEVWLFDPSYAESGLKSINSDLNNDTVKIILL